MWNWQIPGKHVASNFCSFQKIWMQYDMKKWIGFNNSDDVSARVGAVIYVSFSPGTISVSQYKDAVLLV